MDAHFWIHLPKLFVWCCFEFCIIYLAAAYPANFNFIITGTAEVDSATCQNAQYTCKTGVPYKVLTTLWICFLVLYMLIVQAYIRQIRQRLLLAPYKDYIHVHLMVQRLRTQVLYLAVLGVAMVPVLWYTKWDRCNNYFVAWLGLLPLQVIATSMVFTNAFYFMPIRPDNQSVRREWLQEFAWMESSVDEAVQHRGAHNPLKAAELLKEPMFCFESAIKLLLWSELVYYDYSKNGEQPLTLSEGSPRSTLGCCGCLWASNGDRPGEEVVKDDQAAAPVLAAGDELRIEAVGSAAKPPQSEGPCDGLMEDQQLDTDALLQVAMEMYDLQDFEIIHEDLLETRVLIAWSSTTAVVAFRGTAAMANALSNAKAWRTAHPPERGTWYLGRRPMVHKGFLETWRVNRLHERIISRVKGIVEAGSVAPEDFRLYFTGHSLGGALATLAAIDLQRVSSFPRLQVYTYGAPRTGNHAFAREYEALVPHTWHLINDRDAVPRSGKFWILYKRPGQRTLINQVGDMRVRPAVLEVSILTTGFSIRQHYMASYLRSLWSVCVAQCIPSKRVPGGRQAVDRLAASPQMQAYFATLNLDIKGLSEKKEEEVMLPTIADKSKKLESMCNFGIIDLFINFVDDLLPFSENAAATLSLSGNADEPQEEEQPDHLAARLSAINMQRKMSSSIGLAERGPPRCFVRPNFDPPVAASQGDRPYKSVSEQRPAQPADT